MAWELVHRLGAGMRSYEHAALTAFVRSAVPDAKQAAEVRAEGTLVPLGAELATVGRQGAARRGSARPSIRLCNNATASLRAAGRWRHHRGRPGD